MKAQKATTYVQQRSL